MVAMLHHVEPAQGLRQSSLVRKALTSQRVNAHNFLEADEAWGLPGSLLRRSFDQA
jgi:hypothetical protein